MSCEFFALAVPLHYTCPSLMYHYQFSNACWGRDEEEEWYLSEEVVLQQLGR